MGEADAAAQPAVAAEGAKVYTLEEVSKHATDKDCWLIIDGKVYDVTKFMDEHPGGDEVMLSSTGKDATDDFEDVGHSTGARKQLQEFYIGELDMSTLPVKPAKASTEAGYKPASSSSNIFTTVLQFLVPVAILALAVAVRFLTKKEARSSSSTSA